MYPRGTTGPKMRFLHVYRSTVILLKTVLVYDHVKERGKMNKITYKVPRRSHSF